MSTAFAEPGLAHAPREPYVSGRDGAQPMLFYAKKYLALELLVAVLLGTTGWCGMRAYGIARPIVLDARALSWSLATAGVLTGWTFAVQAGYSLFAGRDYAESLTRSLAHHYAHASPLQIVAAAFAAGGEELLFRGFIQGAWGILAGAVAFMVAHIGAREIRVIGYWSVFQGLLLGVAYAHAKNLVVPIVAHGLFDLGAMLYFKWLMTKPACA